MASDPNVFWEQVALSLELVRAVESCNGCRIGAEAILRLVGSLMRRKHG